MKIELRKFKHYPRLSEETVAFNADVYVDGVLVAYAENDGKGGNNRIDAAKPEHRSKVEEMEAWALAQPANVSEFGSLAMNLDFYISLLVEDMVNEKIYAKNRKVFDQFSNEVLAKILKFNNKGDAFANGHNRIDVIANMAKDAAKGSITMPTRAQFAAL